MAKTVFDAIGEGLAEDYIAAKEFLSNGGPKDYAEYREVVGLIRGLSSAVRRLKEVESAHIGDNDDD
jgi:hypothetical protein